MKYRIRIIVRELFQISLIVYLTLLVVEEVKHGFVSYFFNLNYLLVGVILSGILTIGLEKYQILTSFIKKNKLGANDWELFVILSIGAGMLIYLKTNDLGSISLLFTILTSIVVFLLSYLIMKDNSSE